MGHEQGVLETNKNKFRFEPKQTETRSVSRLFRKTKKKNFDLFRCLEPISKQPKQTDLFPNKPKQTVTTLDFLKNSQIYFLLNCLGGSSVCFGSMDTLCFGIEAKQLKQTVSKQTKKNKTKKTKKKKEKTGVSLLHSSFYRKRLPQQQGDRRMRERDTSMH